MTRKSYPSDLTDKEWQHVQKLLPAAKSGTRKGGRPREVDLREILNAIFYVLRGGIAWKYLPHDLPAKSTVYEYFSQWRDDGTWQKINARLREKVRCAAGRKEEPSAAILDSQSVKTTDHGGESGYDGGKKIKGRKRHILVDTLGLLLVVVVTGAGVSDPAGAKAVLSIATWNFSRLRRIWADSAYGGSLIAWVKEQCLWLLEVVARLRGQKGFVVLPRRWVVERTFAWFGKYRRLSKDYEYHVQSSEAMIYAGMIYLMLKRLCR